MFRKLPWAYRVIFVLSVIAAILSVPTMALVLYDLKEQAEWRQEDQDAIATDGTQHAQQMSEHEKTRRACSVGHYGW